MLNIPLVTHRPPAPALPGGMSRMDLRIEPGPPRTVSRAIAPGCRAVITDTYEFAGYTEDGFRIRHVEEWPDLSGCSSKPPGSPSNKCRSERLMAFQVVEACPADCSIRLDPARRDGPKASCACEGGRTTSPTPR